MLADPPYRFDALTELGAAVEDSLANFKRPKQYVFLSALPRNTMGKVQKNQLRDSYADLFGTMDL